MLDDDERMSAAVIARRNGLKRYEVGIKADMMGLHYQIATFLC